MAEERSSGRTPVIAVSLAIVALVTVAIALIVTATRGPEAPTAAAAPAPVEGARAPLKHRVQATDVVRLDRDTLAPTTHASGTSGIKVTDAELRQILALGPEDVITGISGRPVKRQFDVFDALMGASMMNATALYVELIRDDKPVLVQWELDGDLRAARTGARKTQIGGSTLPFSPSSTPDPLVDTIKKIDDFTYEGPRSTLDAVFANPMTVSRGARIVPAMKLGQPIGMKIYAVRPTSLFAAVGLQNGDTITAVNGHALTDANAMLDMYDKLKGSSEIRIELERRGRPQSLLINVTR